MRPAWAAATAAYCAFLFWLSSGPVPVPESVSFVGLDKVAHAGAYGLLALIVWSGMARSGRGRAPRRMFWTAALFAAFYGATDELHQYFVPTRTFDPADWLADAAGAFAAAGGAWWFRLRGWFPFAPEPKPSPGD